LLVNLSSLSPLHTHSSPPRNKPHTIIIVTIISTNTTSSSSCSHYWSLAKPKASGIGGWLFVMSILGPFGSVVEHVIVEDIEKIASQFQDTFRECVRHVQKPNVLVTGVTGAGMTLRAAAATTTTSSSSSSSSSTTGVASD
jgi:hypothetical protein